MDKIKLFYVAHLNPPNKENKHIFQLLPLQYVRASNMYK